MDWTDQGIVLMRRKHGETAAIVSLLTREHGRHAGLVRGGAGKRASALWQAGNLVGAHWRARLVEHLGTMTGEAVDAFAARALDDPLRLAGISSACAILEAALPEREPHNKLFETTVALLRTIDGATVPGDWGSDYVRWEAECLTEFGFGLDLRSCAVTGERDGLAYVSPRSGRAVSTAAGAGYKDRLFRLPAFLAARNGEGQATGDGEAVADGLKITGHFLERHVLAPHDRHMPAARVRFAERWRKFASVRQQS